MTVARATWRDLGALGRLERECFGRDSYDPVTLWLLIVWPGNVALKAMQDGALVGFVAGDQPPGEAWAWVVTLAVAARARRKGIGSRLLGECESRLTPRVLRLMVRQSNAAAIALYQEQGYVQVGRQSRYYPDGETGLLMEKRRG